MKAFILAAGMGSRLGELTENLPKPLIEVKGRKLLDYTLNSLINQGVDHIGLNLHYHGGKIRDHIAEKNYGKIQFEFFEENQLLDTGGALINAIDFFTDDDNFFILHNADVITDIEFQPMLDYFYKEQPLALLATSQRQTSRPLIFDEQGQLLGRGQAGQSGARGFNGVHIISTRLFQTPPPTKGAFSIIDWYLACIKRGERILSYDVSDNQWFDVGTPARLKEANEKLIHNTCFQLPQ